MDDIKYFYDSKTDDSFDIKKISVTVEKKEYSDSAKLKVTLKGPSIDGSISNAIRRTVMQSIPAYGFRRENNGIIIHEKTKCINNNDMIFGIVETLPLFDIDNAFEIIDPAIYDPKAGKNQSITKNDKQEKLKTIKLMIVIENNKDEHLFVTTHHASLFVNGTESNSYKKHPPITLMVLRKGERLSLEATATLGTELKSATYQVVTNAVSIPIDDVGKSFYIKYESLGQLNKYDIFVKACHILCHRLSALSRFVKNEYNDRFNGLKMVTIQINGEEDTLGYIIQIALQKYDKVKTAAYRLTGTLENNIIISYELYKEEKNPLNVLEDILQYLIAVYTAIANKIEKN